MPQIKIEIVYNIVVFQINRLFVIKIKSSRTQVNKSSFAFKYTL